MKEEGASFPTSRLSKINKIDSQFERIGSIGNINLKSVDYLIS